MAHRLVIICAAISSCQGWKKESACGQDCDLNTGTGSLLSEVDLQGLRDSNKISQALFRGLQNASLVLEAALDANLPWNMTYAEHVVTESLRYVQSGNMRADSETTLEVAAKLNSSAAAADWTNFGNKAGLAGAVAGQTATLVTKLAKGKSITVEDGFKAAGAILPAMAVFLPPPANFIAGTAATVLCGFLGGMFAPPPPNPSPMEKLRQQIMKETQQMVTNAVMRQQMANLHAELQTLSEELMWVPGMLEDSSPHVKLMYMLMIQHDLSKMSLSVRLDSRANTAGANRQTWGCSVMPLLGVVEEMHAAVLADISRYNTGYVKPISDRLTQVLLTDLNSYGKFYDKIVGDAKVGCRSTARANLGWTSGKTGFPRRRRRREHRRRRRYARRRRYDACKKQIRGKSKTSGDTDFAAELGCTFNTHKDLTICDVNNDPDNCASYCNRVHDNQYNGNYCGDDFLPYVDKFVDNGLERVRDMNRATAGIAGRCFIKLPGKSTKNTHAAGCKSGVNKWFQDEPWGYRHGEETVDICLKRGGDWTSYCGVSGLAGAGLFPPVRTVSIPRRRAAYVARRRRTRRRRDRRRRDRRRRRWMFR